MAFAELLNEITYHKHEKDVITAGDGKRCYQSNLFPYQIRKLSMLGTSRMNTNNYGLVNAVRMILEYQIIIMKANLSISNNGKTGKC